MFVIHHQKTYFWWVCAIMLLLNSVLLYFTTHLLGESYTPCATTSLLSFATTAILLAGISRFPFFREAIMEAFQDYEDDSWV